MKKITEFAQNQQGLQEYFDQIENAELVYCSKMVWAYWVMCLGFPLSILIPTILTYAPEWNVLESLDLFFVLLFLNFSLLFFPIYLLILILKRSKFICTVKYCKNAFNNYHIFYFYKNRIRYIITSRKQAVNFNLKSGKLKLKKDYSYPFWKLNLDERNFSSLKMVENWNDKNIDKELPKSISRIRDIQINPPPANSKYNFEFRKNRSGMIVKYYPKFMLRGNSDFGTIKFVDNEIKEHRVNAYYRYKFQEIHPPSFVIELPQSFQQACLENGVGLPESSYIQIIENFDSKNIL
jgi:hypothetical protein